MWILTHQAHPHESRFWTCQRDDCVGVGQEETVAVASRQKPHRSIGLAVIRLKYKRSVSVFFDICRGSCRGSLSGERHHTHQTNQNANHPTNNHQAITLIDPALDRGELKMLASFGLMLLRKIL